MDENSLPSIIPDQQTGAKTDIKASEECTSVDEAKQLFSEARQRLLNVNNWHHLCGAVSATFKLTDEAGNEVNQEVQTGNYFKIDIPGPGTVTGEGYDWVKVERIEARDEASVADEIVAIKVRPASNPLNAKTDVAHFFTDEATSSFLVQRTGNTVTAEVHGRNEKPNTAADAVVDKTRNTMVATGAIVGFSSAQWKSLVSGILGKKQSII
ncbi:MAG TPA: hypothetical protein VF622_07455 [Segetibacter sp.]|jgi:hypothetical protein